MDYVDILNAFKEKFNMKTDSFIYDVVKHRPMIFYIDKRSIFFTESLVMPTQNNTPRPRSLLKRS